MKILFIQTGGSIDKDYPNGKEDDGYYFEITSPAYERILAYVKPGFEYDSQTVLRKDSVDITDEERMQILHACESSDAGRIVITHGTYTMLKTAELLSKVNNKTIVLTGARTPELFKNTDADFNLGSAVAAVSILSPGVYVAMNGLVLPYNKIVFNKEAGQFVEISE